VPEISEWPDDEVLPEYSLAGGIRGKHTAPQILIADAGDVDELTRVETRSKLQSIPLLLGDVDINPAVRRERWRTYLAGTSPASARPERVVLKAVVGGDMVGYLAGHLTTRHGRDAEIQSFYLLRAYQRHGVGTALLRRFLDWLGEHGAASLCVGIAAENPYQAFYLKHGGTHLNPHWIVWDELAALRRLLA
jgi:GNAT superfamily N-acetyltransferase